MSRLYPSSSDQKKKNWNIVKIPNRRKSQDLRIKKCLHLGLRLQHQTTPCCQRCKACCLRQTFRLTVCWVVVAGSWHIANPGSTEKKGSRRDFSTAEGHVTLHEFSCVHMCCVFTLNRKGPSPGFWLFSTDRSPHAGHTMRWGFHGSKLWYQQPLWPPPLMNCTPGKEQQEHPLDNIRTTRDCPTQRLMFVQSLDWYIRSTAVLYRTSVEGCFSSKRYSKAFACWHYPFQLTPKYLLCFKFTLNLI